MISCDGCGLADYKGVGASLVGGKHHCGGVWRNNASLADSPPWTNHDQAMAAGLARTSSDSRAAIFARRIVERDAEIADLTKQRDRAEGEIRVAHNALTDMGAPRVEPLAARIRALGNRSA